MLFIILSFLLAGDRCFICSPKSLPLSEKPVFGLALLFG